MDLLEIGTTGDCFKVYAFEVDEKIPKKIWIETPFEEGSVSVYKLKYDEDYFLNILVEEDCTNQVSSSYLGSKSLMSFSYEDNPKEISKDLSEFWLYEIWNLATIPQDICPEQIKPNYVFIPR